MAFQFKFSAGESGTTCEAILITDTTGTYNVTTNPSGYGAPNFVATDCDACTIVVTPPNEDALTAINLVTLASFPASGSTATLDYETDLGGTGTMPSGIWTFAITTTFADGSQAPNTSTYTVYANIQCSTDCCIMELSQLVDADSCCDDCEDEALEKFKKAKMLQDAVAAAFECEQYERANRLQVQLDALCADTDCGCGS